MENKKILGFDTTSGMCSAALLDGQRIAAYAEEKGTSHQTERLFAMLDEVFRSTGTTYKDIDAIAVSTGPGSFTGVRVGIAAARGIRLANKLPQIGVNSLEAVAWRTLGKSTAPIVSVMDAKRGQLYAQIFSSDLTALSEPLVLNYKQLVTIVPEEQFTLVGSGSEIAAGVLEAGGTKDFTVSKVSVIPDAKAVVRVAALRLPDAANVDVAPLYLRKPDAKISKLRLDLKNLVNS